MPEKDCTPKFDCATLNALCLLISGQPKAAIVQCESALQRHSKTEHCHRVLGEAHLQLGNNEEALAALTVATTVDRDFPSLWLCGLAHHNLGNEKEADELLSKAKRHNKNAQDYSDAKDLSYYYTPAATVDWLNKDLDSYSKPSKDQVYWDELFLEKLHSTDLNELCALVPEEFRTLAMFEACVTPPKEEIRNFHLNGQVIKYFKHLPITKEIALKAVAVQSSTCAISDLPETLVDRSIYLATSWLPIKEIPEEYLDTEMYLHAVKKHSFNFTDVPREFKSDEIAVQAIASGFLNYDKNIDQMPKRYLEDEFLQQAIALDINAIDNLPAKLVNKQLFDFAQKKYSSESAWQSILDKHHPSTVEDAHWSYRPREYLDKVWACFWTAASIELAVEEGASLHGISSDAFFSEHTILARKLSSEKLDLVPRELLTQELCDLACNKSKYGSVIEDIPVAMRSAELCQKAVQKNSTNLRYVPLDHRTIKLCAIAYDDRSSNIAAIPYEIYIGVFDYLLKDPDSDWNESHLYLMRGIGHFVNNDYKPAINDFEKSRKNRIEISDESLLKSYYFQGWAHYKLNQTGRSLKNFAQSQETDDKDELEYTEPYETAKLPKVVVDVVDLNLPLFKSKLRRANGLMDAQYFDEALLELINLEKTLTEIDTVEESLKQSNCAAMILWAEVWEYKVRCLSEMGHVADCVKLCQQRLDTLHSLKAFDYYPYTYDGVGYDLRPVHGAIRCMSAQLAKHCIEIGDLEKGLELSLQSIAPPNSGEHDETSYGFYEQHLENLLHASEFDKSYLSQLKRVYKSSTVRRLIKEDDIARNLVMRIKNKLEN